MDLIINFKNIGEITIELRRQRKLIDALDFSFQGNLDDLLISSVDKILKRNRIEALSLKTIRTGGIVDPALEKGKRGAKRSSFFKGGVDQNSSAFKIALTFKKAWKEAKKL